MYILYNFAGKFLRNNLYITASEAGTVTVYNIAGTVASRQTEKIMIE
jgi:hypothetical protein